MNAESGQRRRERIDRGIKVRTAGLYALMSWRELAYLILPRLVLIVGLLGLPMAMPGMYWQRVISIVCIYALLALVFDFLAHFVGLVSLGGAFFVGTGGYLSAILNVKLGLSPLLCVPVATLLGGAVCTLLLLPLPAAPRGVFRHRHADVPAAPGARVIEALNILGGTDGIMGIDSLPSAWMEQYLVIVLVLVVLFGLRRLVNTDLGLVLRAVKDNDQAVRASAMNVTFYKSLGVFIGASVGCLAGACWCTSTCGPASPPSRWTSPCCPSPPRSSGGSGTLVGPVLGCLILVPVSELLRDFGTLRIVFYSLILLGFTVFRSEGLMVFGQRKYHQFERWKSI